MRTHPVIIQGGMGVGISDWRLARTVSQLGHLGVVSGTGLDQVLARRLQSGDPGDHMRRALDRFPVPALAAEVWDRFYVPGGKPDLASFHLPEIPTPPPSPAWLSLCVIANFVEVFLAKERHAHPVGINYLEKIQIPHLPSLYGAMLAGVDYVLMGAGIPLKVPGVLDTYVTHAAATYPLAVTGGPDNKPVTLSFDPAQVTGLAGPDLTRPHFLAIIASDVLALTLQRRANGRVDGFVVEGPTAGGHNAPPRGALRLSDRGEPLYGARDVVDLDKLGELGLPFWLAGGSGSPDGLRRALARGAAGVQVGTAFAMCAESGLRDDYKQALLQQVLNGTTDIRTEPRVSPTGFPFKVAQVPGTLSEPAVLEKRPRICDLGFLREAYRTTDGTVGFRCPAEPVSLYTSKGGDAANTGGRVCVCNALLATAGFPQARAGARVEPGIVTMGDDLPGVARFLPAGASRYTAADVIATILADPPDAGIPTAASPPPAARA